VEATKFVGSGQNPVNGRPGAWSDGSA
jgi:hypothetical protein